MEFNTDTVSKIVNSNELEFYKLASDYELTPKLISYSRLSDLNYKLVMEKFPEVLIDILIDPTRVDLARELIGRSKVLIASLHLINIFHGDISEENIVYDANSNRIALIDFGMSKYISSINKDEANVIIENYYEEQHLVGPPPVDTDDELSLHNYILKLEIAVPDFLSELIPKSAV
jgi:serine/threonine protein kinase